MSRFYKKPEITALADADLPEVLSLLDTTATFMANEFDIKAYRVCNGPADPDLEYCNCSHYVYVGLGTYDLPQEYKAFRIGPFYLAQFTGWNQDKDNPVLYIQHDVKGRKHVDTFRISMAGIQHKQAAAHP
ncbi:hypothetical protein LJY25_03115 [Hymenobacter sp. BT175]|uniref:hypothetical protein n=1 Tax=Hymenobacter translucens TaxID=2886507 RepID=UPI001D0E2815|nr:hypothetical protein [Hymenobacter translucens]MCC2545422.1 hypothetical protein [Hymenobacter translucens]